MSTDHRGLPHNWETERSLLGGLLLAMQGPDGPDLLAEVRVLLEPADLHRPAHQRLFTLISVIADNGGKPDPTLVLDAIETNGLAEEVGGIAYVVALPQACASVDNVVEYARRTVRTALRREAQLAAAEVEEAIQRGADASIAVVNLRRALARVDERTAVLDGARIDAGARLSETAREELALDEARAGAMLPAELARMRRRAAGEDRPVPLPLGWRRAAEELRGGLWPGCHILIGGTGAGKSQWCFNVAYSAVTSADPVPVTYVGLELDKLGMLARLTALGLDARGYRPGGRHVPWSDLYLGRPHALDALESLEGRDALDELRAAPLYLHVGEALGGRSGGWSGGRIRSLAAAMRARHPTGPALIVVDFLQLVAASPLDPREDLRQRIGGAAYAGRMAAREHGVSVLLVSSTARSYYPMFQGEKSGDIPKIDLGKGDPGRFLGTGKESGEVEYAADGVIALGRAAWPSGEPPPPVWLGVAKARTGRAGDGWAAFDFNGTTFVEHSLLTSRTKVTV